MELNLSEEYKSYPPLPKEILFKLPTGNRLVNAESLIKVLRLKLFLIL